jgi:sigma-B regulation protein RsbU (phosphoserine phosphatase)
MFWRLTSQMEDSNKLSDDVSAALLEFDVLEPATDFGF